jgi:CheY-like chemotaxis protein
MPVSILIADDYADNRELLRLMLESDGHRVREARNGRELLHMAQEELPDIFLIDLSMPVLDGWEVLRELRADARTRSLPVIAVSAFDEAVQPRRVVDSSFDAYLTKPFHRKELIETVARLLGRDGDGDK